MAVLSDMSSNKCVTISVLTYNRCEYLDKLLISLTNINYSPLEIIVIDNNSQDETSIIMNNYKSKVVYIKNDKNMGVVARNIGMKKAKGDIVITLDDDVIGITDSDIYKIIETFDTRPNVSAINFKVIDPSTNDVINWVHHCKVEDYHDKTFETYEITEGAVAFRKETLDKVGCYSPHYFISHEGPDLAFRIIESGNNVIYTGDITVNHYTAESGREQWRNYYYDTRNQLWLAGLNFPLTYAVRYLTRGLLSMFIYSIRDGYTKYYFKGIIDGLKSLSKIKESRKVLSKNTMNVIKEIDSMRPSIIYLIKKRLFQRKINI